MGIKKFRPTTPSRRHMTIMSFEEITKTEPEKASQLPSRAREAETPKGV